MVRTDEELYSDFLNGNKEAFEEIVTRHRMNLIYFVSNYTKDTNSAEDIVQDSFVYMLMNKNYFNSNYKLKSYLYTIAKSRAINYINKSKKEYQMHDNFDTQFNTEINDIINLTDQIHNKEKLKRVNEIIQKLNPDYSTIIYLHEFQSMSLLEISKVLNKSVIQVRSLVYNAKKTLRKLLNKEGIFYDE